ncbi:MAG: DivIVA domain-containing protein [Micromonosporaceae bacterium]
MSGVRNFPVAFRGYDRDEVDRLVMNVIQYGIDPDQMRAVAFSTRIRGYDVDAVDDWLERAAEGDVVVPPGFGGAPPQY